MTETMTDEEIRARRETRRSWYGYLADDNVAHVAARIERMLAGRRYTWVSTNTTQPHSMPEVRTGQRLEPEKSTDKRTPKVHRIGDPMAHDPGKSWESAGIIACDTYGVWAMHAYHATEREATEAAHSEAAAGRPSSTTYVFIEGGVSDDPRDSGRRDRIEVTFYNAMSPPEKLQWVIAVEPPESEES